MLVWEEECLWVRRGEGGGEGEGGKGGKGEVGRGGECGGLRASSV